MRRTIGLALGLAALFAAVAPAAAKDWKTVRVGVEGAYEPFNYFDTNKELQGFDVDIAKAVCEKMKVECTFVGPGLGRHHSRAPCRQVRRHRLLHVDHR